MPTHISVLNPVDKKIFESPPVFSEQERTIFFQYPQWVYEILKTLRSPTNKVGFLLQLAYFRATNQFFHTKRFHLRDLEFVAQSLGLSTAALRLTNYAGTTFERHQSIILSHLGFHKFNQDKRKILEKEADALSEKLMRPRSLFMSLVDFLRTKKIEVPSYHALSQIITNSLRVTERKLHEKIKQHLTQEQQNLLDSLLEQDEGNESEPQQESKLKRYKITLLKKVSQSTRPKKIRENIKVLQDLKTLFLGMESARQALGLAPKMIQFYARVALKSQAFHLLERNERKYLYLFTFVIHQYRRVNDLLVDTLLQSFQSALNSVARQHKNEIFNARKSKNLAIKNLSKGLEGQLATLEEIERIVYLPVDKVDAQQKLSLISGLLKKRKENRELKQQLTSLQQETDRILKNDDYYDLLERKSLKLQNRISPILRNLEFDLDNSSKELIDAIDYFKKKAAHIDSHAPLDFLNDEQRKAFQPENKKLRPSLYKVFLFQQVADAIKSGILNLKHSYKYRPFEDYLIPQSDWKARKDELLQRAGLRGIEDFKKLEPEFGLELSEQFKRINQNIQSGKNKHARLHAKGNLSVSTPKVEKNLVEPLASLFPKEQVLPLFEILSTVDKFTNFTESLQHFKRKNIRKRPPSNVFFAGLIGLGCNHGIKRISNISKNINKDELEHTVNWYFTQENLLHSNDRILELLGRLQLPNLYKREKDKTHTSSDGQKYRVHAESLNANFSYKYFGSGKGVTVYVFLDDSHRLFYSTVISSSESEAAYVIDGLMHNEIVQSQLHSTDTAGYSEILFGVCHLLGISFAPRIKNLKKQQLYSFEKPSKIKGLGYQVLPSAQIKTRLLVENWEQILRFIATIRLRHTSASQLFNRLNSYSRQHPLYKALKEFGKIIKTRFILRYIDDLEFRQAVGKQLNKQESSNKLGKAVFHGGNQEFRQATKEEQILAETCKRLIENSIICWNYLYLSQELHRAGSQEEKKRMLEIIESGSVVTWQHINMQGEYDFSNELWEDTIKLGMDELLALQVL